ncbi:MAG: O-antigen ligase family protein [Flavisolibacter sp.]
MIRLDKIFFWGTSLVFLYVLMEAAFQQETVYLFYPLVLVAALLLLQFPEFLLYTLLVSIPWSIAFNFNEHLSTDLPDEPLMLLSSLAFFILFIHQKKKERGSFHPIISIILLQLLWTFFTVLTSTDFLVSLKYFLAKCWYLLAFLGLPLYLFRDKKIMARSGVLLLLSMMICMMVVLVRQTGNNWSFEKINDALRPFYPNHVDYAALLVFMVPLLLACRKLSASKAIKNLCLIFLFITVVALYFSYSRGAWMALLTGSLSYWFIRKRILFAAYILLVALCLAAVFWLGSNDRYLRFHNEYKSTIFHNNFEEHLVATYKMKDVSTAERFYRWVAGVRMVKDSWKMGFGPTSFYEHYKSYAVPAFKTWVSGNKEHSTVHNYFLLLIIEQGVVGLLLFLILLGALFWNIQLLYKKFNDPFYKTILACVGSLLMMECTVNFLSDLIETDKVGSVFYLCVAVVVMVSGVVNSE